MIVSRSAAATYNFFKSSLEFLTMSNTRGSGRIVCWVLRWNFIWGFKLIVWVLISVFAIFYVMCHVSRIFLPLVFLGPWEDRDCDSYLV